MVETPIGRLHPTFLAITLIATGVRANVVQQLLERERVVVVPNERIFAERHVESSAGLLLTRIDEATAAQIQAKTRFPYRPEWVLLYHPAREREAYVTLMRRAEAIVDDGKAAHARELRKRQLRDDIRQEIVTRGGSIIGEQDLLAIGWCGLNLMVEIIHEGEEPNVPLHVKWRGTLHVARSVDDIRQILSAATGRALPHRMLN